MIKCLVVDDEPLAQQVIIRHIDRTDGLQLVGTCVNATEAYSFIHNNDVDLIFLDIKMPVMSGIDFIRSLKNPPSFIFTTAYSDFAVQSYDLEAVDYLLKPVTLQRFQAAIAKYRKQHISPEAERSYSYFKVDGKLQKIDYADLLYARSIKDYIVLATPHKNYITHMTMKYLEDMLPDHIFKRVHRSFLVNLTMITAISRDQINIGDISVPVGESYKSWVRSLRSSNSPL